MSTLIEFADKLRREVDIARVVEGYVELRRGGLNLKGLCPFHREKTPSFTVSPSKQIFHCFGCGEGGDVIKFIQKIERVEWIDAVRLLSERNHIPMPEPRGGPRASQTRSERERLLAVNAFAAKHFAGLLAEALADAAHPAAQYLSRRKIDAPLAQRFGLGLSADAWSGLTGAARSAGFDTAGLAGAGLAIQNTQSPGRYYDRFRNRLIFPIADTMGRPVAFGGRVYAPNAAPDEPKYVNSPETLLYRKGQLLYALHLAKDAIVREKRALLMEGYMDVIRAHQNGLTAAVASCGTALTIEQAQALKKLCGQVVFVYDGDEAGQNAMLRGCEILLECEFDIRIVALPKDHDPDSFLLKHGAEKFADMIGTAPDFFTFFLDGACRRYDTRTPTGKVQAADFLMPLLSRMKNPIARQAYTRQEAERLEIDDALIMQQLNNRAGPAMNRLKEQIENQASAEHKGEKMLLRLAVESPEVRAQLAKRFDLVWVRNPSLRSWLGTCISMGAHENISWDDLFASCATEDERGSLRALIIELDEWEPPNTSVRAIAHTLARIELNYRRRISRELVRQIDQFYQAGDEQETLACTRSLDETAKPVPALGRQYFIRRQNP